VSIVALVVGDAIDLDDLEVEDLEDREESLDRILREKLAGDEEPVNDPDDLDDGPDLVTLSPTGATTRADLIEVPRCGPDEFVCRACFLVLSRVQRAEASETTCRDCAI